MVILPLRVHGWVWSALVGLVLILSVVARSGEGQGFWDGWPESSDLRRPGYAERVYSHDLFRTRANTWSNLAFVLVGFYALAIGRQDRHPPHSSASGYLARTPAMSLLFGLSCCSLGVGSGFFHASLTRTGQQLDVASMYAPLLVAIAVNCGRCLPQVRWPGRPRSLPTWPGLGALVLVACILLYQFKWSMSARTVLSTLILMVAAGALLDVFRTASQMNFRWLTLASISLLAGLACRQLDVAGRFSGPDAWLQGHALWHFFTALSLGCLLLYYRSEVLSPLPVQREKAPD